MINFATIGTNWITESFINGTLVNNDLKLAAVYSRNLDNAKTFADKFAINLCFDDLEALSKCDEVEAVYIASPNSLHFEQALLMLENGKHVICEKPLASHFQQVEKLYQAAIDNNVILYEAYKTAQLPNFKQIKENISELGKLRKAHIHYCQYSSRYQRYLDGEIPNTFNPEFSNGSIMDIGYYCIAFTVALFGKPKRIQADAIILGSGVDGCGAVLLTYDGFSVTIDHSKISRSEQVSEIQGEEGNLLIKGISVLDDVTLVTDSIRDLTLPQEQDQMSYEASFFAEQIKQGVINDEAMLQAKNTSEVITEIRRLTGVNFPADDI
ncbi:Gfo/Idh/MocA family oxidoreductase [Psychromonas aquatilis]|uniref:Gfo/Idh/MocA family oxidoreductase n=1 Tax=Psychromonas aquatilis TaxID=2005072 RepID=A0ABU9GLL6_9GAMM